MTAEYIMVTPDTGDEHPKQRRIMCQAIAAYYENDDGETILVLMSGEPSRILDSPEKIDAQLERYFPEPLPDYR